METAERAVALDREALLSWYRLNRERTEAWFDTVRPESYEARPIALRNPICFYEGHIPAFSVNTLLKRALRDPGIDPALEVLFERGIDPEDEQHVPSGASRWPSRDAIRAKILAADIIYVGGGNTLPLMRLWRRLNVGRCLKSDTKKGLCSVESAPDRSAGLIRDTRTRWLFITQGNGNT